MYKLFVAFRYLRRNWLNLIGVVAVFLGVLALICVLSVMKGFAQEFRSRIRATLSDLIVESWYGEPFPEYESLMAAIEKLPHVRAVAPQYDGLGIVKIGRHHQFSAFHGIDLDREVKTTEFADYWRAWRGRAAREELDELFAVGAVSPGPDEKIKDLASRLRREDFNLLSGATRARIRQWAAQQAFDLDAALAAAARAMPDWGASDRPDLTPVIAGGELLTLGRTESGQIVTLPVGKTFSLTTVSPADMRSSDDVRRIVQCRVAGGFRSGLYDYDRETFYLPISDVQKFMTKPGHATSINVRLDSFDHAPQVRAAILGLLTPDELEEGLALVRNEMRSGDPATLRSLEARIRELRERSPVWWSEGDPNVIRASRAAVEALIPAMSHSLRRRAMDPARAAQVQAFQQKVIERTSGGIDYTKYRISTWEDKRRTFLRAVDLERRVMAFILFFLVVIAGLLIFSNLLTTVVSKTRDIGTLKSIGGSVRGIMSIFLLNGLLIGVVGSILGAAVSVLITRNINEIEHFLRGIFGFSFFPPDIYYFDRIPVDQHPWPNILVICAVAILVSLAAAAYPAWKASRMDPVEALRYE